MFTLEENILHSWISSRSLQLVFGSKSLASAHLPGLETVQTTVSGALAAEDDIPDPQMGRSPVWEDRWEE